MFSVTDVWHVWMWVVRGCRVVLGCLAAAPAGAHVEAPPRPAAAALRALTLQALWRLLLVARASGHPAAPTPSTSPARRRAEARAEVGFTSIFRYKDNHTETITGEAMQQRSVVRLLLVEKAAEARLVSCCSLFVFGGELGAAAVDCSTKFDGLLVCAHL